MNRMNPAERRQKAEECFLQGYNCSQCILTAFADILPEGSEAVLKACSPFGGGMGRLREVCGSFSGSLMILGVLYGYDTPEKGDKKKALYEQVQELACAFEEKQGSIVCRELLGLTEKHDAPTPEPRTEAYYQKRPCREIIGTAAELLAEFIKAHPLD